MIDFLAFGALGIFCGIAGIRADRRGDHTLAAIFLAAFVFCLVAAGGSE